VATFQIHIPDSRVCDQSELQDNMDKMCTMFKTPFMFYESFDGALRYCKYSSEAPAVGVLQTELYALTIISHSLTTMN
jgi:hypothetical protein